MKILRSKLIPAILLVLIISALFSSCSEPNPAPIISMKSDGTEVPYMSQTVKDPATADTLPNHKSRFSHLLKKESTSPAVDLGDILKVSFVGTAPDTLTLHEWIVEKDGTPLYHGIERTLTAENSTYTTKIESHIEAMFSSDSNFRVESRGFKLTCKWGEKTKNYYFVLRESQPTLLK